MSTALPANLCDRMIIAAHMCSIPVVTTDLLFVRYGIAVIA
jgi:hypothetical protein